MSVAPDGRGVNGDVFKKANDQPYSWSDRLYSIYLQYRLGSIPRSMKGQVIYINLQAAKYASRKKN